MLIDRYMNSLREDSVYNELTVSPQAFEALQSKGHDVSIDAISKKLTPGQKKVMKKAALGAAAVGAAGGAVALGAKALKKHRAKKAQEVAVEEGVSLEEAFEYVLECEQMLLDEGYEYDEIYEEGLNRGEVATKVGNKMYRNAQLKKLGKRAAIGAAAAGAVGGAAALGAKALKKHRDKKAQEVAVEEGVSLEEAFEYVLEMEQVLLDEGYDFVEIYDEMNVPRVPAKSASGLNNVENLANASARVRKLGNTAPAPKKGLGERLSGAAGAAGSHIMANKGKYAAGAAALGAAALGAAALKKHRAKKAQEVAVEEGVSLEEAFEYVLAMEQEYLNEGYSFEDIYMI